MPLGGQIRTFLQARTPPLMRMRPPLCVRALASFRPLETQLCPLGLFYAPWGSSTCPPYVYVPPLCVCDLDSIKPLRGSFMPLGAQLCPLGLFYAL
jgi:hypothetical protein